MADFPDLSDPRFGTQRGWRIAVQVPVPDIDRVLDAVLEHDRLAWGDYDQVSFCSSPGVQTFRSLPGGVNAPTSERVRVACAELSFFTGAGDGAGRLALILKAVYAAHPYEEPVIQVIPALRSLHVRGIDEGNPNRFWNRADADWVPAAHRRSETQGGNRQGGPAGFDDPA